MSKVIICANQKGGVAKTTSVVNIGIGLSRLGKKVLVIDNDPQGSLTEALGYPEPDKLEITLATIMEWVLNEEEFDVEAGILHHEEGIDLLPANIELSGVETSLIGIMSSETVLREYIEMVRHKYDYILVDCSPNLGQLTLNALVAADEVIIPVQAAYLPIKGLEQLLKTISRVKRKMNPSLNIMGILITMVDYRTVYANEITEILYQHYGNNIHIFEEVIPMSVRAAETAAEGVSIYKHDPNGKVAKAYDVITKEVAEHE
ncbi:MAG: AAA family ATPase [Roseburia sp.]|nr:AAA family ATPase [Roseburia sp.]